MVASVDVSTLPEGFVRLVASTPLRSSPDAVAELLAGDAMPWADGRVEHPEGRGLRRFAADLRLRVGTESASATFGKAAYVDIGHPRRTADGWDVEIGWRASRAAPLFPVFSGWLSIRPGELHLEGVYAPPGGVLGRVADRMLLHVAANGTARWLLGEIDRAAIAAD